MMMEKQRALRGVRCVGCMMFLLLLLLPAAAWASPQVLPRPSSMTYVVDKASMISSEEADKIAEMGKALDRETGAQIVVVTIPTLGDASLEEYATTLFRNWGIGNAEKNNGVLLLIAKEDRKFRIEVGYGLEGAITDGYAGSVLDGMKTEFKNENYSEAIVTAYAKLTQKAYEEYGVEVPETVKDEAEEPLWGIVLGVAIFFGLMALIFSSVWGFFRNLLNILSSGRLFADSADGTGGGTSDDYDRRRYDRSSNSNRSDGGSFGGGRSGGGGASGGW